MRWTSAFSGFYHCDCLQAESIDFKEVPDGLQCQLTFWRDFEKSLNITVTVIVNGFESAAGKVRTLESLFVMSNQLCFISLFQRQPNNIHHCNTSKHKFSERSILKMFADTGKINKYNL